MYAKILYNTDDCDCIAIKLFIYNRGELYVWFNLLISIESEV